MNIAAPAILRGANHYTMKTLLALLLLSASLRASDYTKMPEEFQEPRGPTNDVLHSFGGRVFSETRLRWMRNQGVLQEHGLEVVNGIVRRTVPVGTVVVSDGTGTIPEGKAVIVLDYGGLADKDKLSMIAKEKGVATYTTPLTGEVTLRAYQMSKPATPDEAKAYMTAEDARFKTLSESAAQWKRERLEWAQRMVNNAKAASDKRALEADAKVTAAYRRRADSGDADAQFETGLRLLIGKGTTKDENEARRFLELAAKQGHKGAQKRLEIVPPK